jgi:mono/diheme cytochrome c family protein
MRTFAMYSARSSLVVLAVFLLAGCEAVSSRSDVPAADMLRGRDLYQTFCSACHTAQMHWRDQRLVKSWNDLRTQVSRWQNYAGQGWSREEIDDVAAYLNAAFYGVPCPLRGCGGPSAGPVGAVRLAQNR